MPNNFGGARRVAALTAGVVTTILLGSVAGHAQAISFVFSGNTNDALHNYNSSGRINKVTHNGTGKGFGAGWAMRGHSYPVQLHRLWRYGVEVGQKVTC